jgi:hypothetical protein
MKSLLVYISPNKKLDSECELLARIQVDNSRRLGVDKDLLMITNFNYEYGNFKSIQVGSEHYCPSRPRSIKTSIIPALYDLGILDKNELYWNHDFDAYQNNPILDGELGLDEYDAGFTDYGWKDRWCMGSYFFKYSAYEMFDKTKDVIFKNVEDEDAVKGLEKNVKRMNITYNFGKNYTEENFKRADKPLKVLHFHSRISRSMLDFMSDGLKEVYGLHYNLLYKQ